MTIADKRTDNVAAQLCQPFDFGCHRFTRKSRLCVVCVVFVTHIMQWAACCAIETAADSRILGTLKTTTPETDGQNDRRFLYRVDMSFAYSYTLFFSFSESGRQSAKSSYITQTYTAHYKPICRTRQPTQHINRVRAAAASDHLSRTKPNRQNRIAKRKGIDSFHSGRDRDRERDGFAGYLWRYGYNDMLAGCCVLATCSTCVCHVCVSVTCNIHFRQLAPRALQSRWTHAWTKNTHARQPGCCTALKTPGPPNNNRRRRWGRHCRAISHKY